LKEGYGNIDAKIIKSGDVMQDAAEYYSLTSAEKATVANTITHDRFILCTLHRAENTDNKVNLTGIIDALNTINKTIPVVLPLHPRTKGKIADLGLKMEFDIIDPVGYFDMIELLKKCALVMTDSGGLQKEAFFFKKNCVTMREQTEWVELVENKVNVLVGSDTKKIIAGVEQMLGQKADFTIDLYGKGKACENIVRELIKD
ncbi:MAG: UDP-N-acetyl glucosamine 2-epimerase, partial [Flavobacteriales bacterium]|nr:UDP-N-acetyl glucosamine 2-epimerase [Flavobacteriales bacterium]